MLLTDKADIYMCHTHKYTHVYTHTHTHVLQYLFFIYNVSIINIHIYIYTQIQHMHNMFKCIYTHIYIYICRTHRMIAPLVMFSPQASPQALPKEGQEAEVLCDKIHGEVFFFRSAVG